MSIQSLKIHTSGGHNTAEMSVMRPERVTIRPRPYCERRVALSGGRNEKQTYYFQMQLAMLLAARHCGGEVDPRTTQNAARRSVLFEIVAAPLTMAGKELSREEKEFLISEVQSRTFLWNDREKNFKILSMIRKAWEEVGAVLNISGKYK